MNVPPNPLRVVISFAKKDDKYREELEKHLTALKRQELIQIWSEQCIAPGETREEKIAEMLREADIHILLLSPDFVQSSRCYEIDLAVALRRHADGLSCLIPVMVLT